MNSATLFRYILVLMFVVTVYCGMPTVAYSQSKMAPGTSPTPQRGFATAEEAAQAFIQAAEKYDVPALLELLGPDGRDLVAGDPVQDKNRSAQFAAKAHEKNSVVFDRNEKLRATLLVGMDDWPLPIPILKKGGKWYFDSKQGRTEILFRRIGANELDAIQICRGFVEAQQEYASEVHDNSGIHQYAQRIISTPGKHDGLYWDDNGKPGGPIGDAIAKAIQEGYSPGKTSGYHGYYFKVLKGQGPAARLGQLDYVIGGAMIGGFALVAVPAEYRVTGVKTFMVSYDGIVYEKDLGPDSLNIVKRMERYNPDKTWHRTNAQWPDEVAQLGSVYTIP